MRKFYQFLFTLIMGVSLSGVAAYATATPVTIGSLQTDISNVKTAITTDATAVTSAREPLLGSTSGSLAFYNDAVEKLAADKAAKASTADLKADKAAVASARKAETANYKLLMKAYNTELKAYQNEAGTGLINYETKLAALYKKAKDTADEDATEALYVAANKKKGIANGPELQAKLDVKAAKLADAKTPAKGGFAIPVPS